MAVDKIFLDNRVYQKGAPNGPKRRYNNIPDWLGQARDNLALYDYIQKVIIELGYLPPSEWQSRALVQNTDIFFNDGVTFDATMYSGTVAWYEWGEFLCYAIHIFCNIDVAGTGEIAIFDNIFQGPGVSPNWFNGGGAAIQTVGNPMYILPHMKQNGLGTYIRGNFPYIGVTDIALNGVLFNAQS